MRFPFKYVAGFSGLAIVAGLTAGAVEDKTDVQNRSFPERALIFIALGGAIYFATEEYKRHFRPEEVPSYFDLLSL